VNESKSNGAKNLGSIGGEEVKAIYDAYLALDREHPAWERLTLMFGRLGLLPPSEAPPAMVAFLSAPHDAGRQATASLISAVYHLSMFTRTLLNAGKLEHEDPLARWSVQGFQYLGTSFTWSPMGPQWSERELNAYFPSLLPNKQQEEDSAGFELPAIGDVWALSTKEERLIRVTEVKEADHQSGHTVVYQYLDEEHTGHVQTGLSSFIHSFRFRAKADWPIQEEPVAVEDREIPQRGTATTEPRKPQLIPHEDIADLVPEPLHIESVVGFKQMLASLSEGESILCNGLAELTGYVPVLSEAVREGVRQMACVTWKFRPYRQEEWITRTTIHDAGQPSEMLLLALRKAYGDATLDHRKS
jgi:hypothetical protein